MARNRLVFKGVSEILGTDDLGLLILTDETERRQVSIVCDKAMAVMIEIRVNKLPVAGIMLPEVLWKMASRHGDPMVEILIDDLQDGQYRALVTGGEFPEPMRLRASDAVLLSIISGMPIYMESRLMARQSVPYEANANGVALPVNVISDDMLRKALRKAVEDENYELASQLRDELRNRHGSLPGTA